MTRISALGDTALLLPASLALLAYLAATRRWSLASGFGLALLAGGATTLGAKLLFNACGTEITTLDIISPSGHASFSATVYGSVAIAVSVGRTGFQRASIRIGAVALVAAIAASRVALGWHSVPEVAFGLAVGAAAVSIFGWLHDRAGRPKLPLPPLAVGFAVLLVLVGGRHFTPETHIVRLAREVSSRLDVCGTAPTAQADLRAARRDR